MFAVERTLSLDELSANALDCGHWSRPKLERSNCTPHSNATFNANLEEMSTFIFRAERDGHCQYRVLLDLSDLIVVHPSFFRLTRSWLWRQQTKQHRPDILLRLTSCSSSWNIPRHGERQGEQSEDSYQEAELESSHLALPERGKRRQIQSE